jgi:hypothetical protein
MFIYLAYVFFCMCDTQIDAMMTLALVIRFSLCIFNLYPINVFNNVYFLDILHNLMGLPK